MFVITVRKERAGMAKTYGGKSAMEREQERRERLIAAGRVLFADQGFANVGIERLSTWAHLSMRAFYRCFHTKEDLLAAVMSRCLDDTVTAVVMRLERSPDEPVAVAETAVRAYIEHVTTDRRAYRLLHVERFHLAGRSAWGDPLAMILTGTLKGRLDWPDRELRLMVAALAGVVPALLGEWARDEAVSVDQVVETAARLCSVILGSAEAIRRAARMGSTADPPSGPGA
ncbi:TetR family transcriptional regulator [Nonomuraea phyllanthi]|uniref:TetR/AcrR family transcriptional regulator n=1 Tax=Nonomuraea phyllanthi TaxID=2219224 RepID=UPI00129303BA|nr:TetR/AcrR family transcriptional regulator [Nonomuraea phyllanthi]QFY06149.1 TetR family transcriptional regulator [Nonomuraea phyllanthi]